MNRTLIVSLIKKNIDELILLTQGFAEMKEYPEAILSLAKNKTDDIKQYIEMLRNLKEDPATSSGFVDVKPSVESIENQEVKPTSVLHTDTDQLSNNVASPHQNINNETVSPIATERPAATEVKQAEVKTSTPETAFTAQKTVSDVPTTLKPEVKQAVETTTPEIKQIIPEEIEPKKELEKGIANDHAKKNTLGDKISASSISRNDAHAKSDKTGVHANIANKKIEDIRQAISLGDRFRFQRELFRNNGEEMNKTLSYINLLATYEEVEAFLLSKYGWTDDNEAAHDFYQIVKRKF